MHSDQQFKNIRVSLTLNGLYYDTIKQFHTKYLCLTAKDRLTIEVINNESQLIGSATLPQPYKLALNQQTIHLYLQQPDITLDLSFDSLLRYNQRSPLKHITQPIVVNSPEVGGKDKTAVEVFPASPQQISLFASERQDPPADTSELLKSKIE